MASLNGQKVNNATLPNLEILQAAGFDPKTGLPFKYGCEQDYKSAIKKILRVIDEQDYINRFTWYNLPPELDGNLIERILYYRGQGMFFFMKETEKFYFLPYTLDGEIDIYGRFITTTPLPFNGSSTDGEKERPWISGLVRKPIYDLSDTIDADINKMLDERCVLISDYSKQYSQTVLSRQILNEPLLDMESDCLPFMRTALLNSTGLLGVRVNSTDESANIVNASKGITNAALMGQKYVPIVGAIEFQELTGNTVANAEEFLVAMQSLDNLRLRTIGVKNGGVYEKKDTLLQSEMAMNTASMQSPLQDSLTMRQNACTAINMMTGLNIWCDVNESAMNMDMNMDGLVGYDQSNAPAAPNEANNVSGGSDAE